MQGLNQSLSSLSLDRDSPSPTGVTRKNKRPNRAFHSFATDSYGLPDPQASAQNNFQPLAASNLGNTSENQASNRRVPFPSSSQRVPSGGPAESITSHYVPKQRLEDQQRYLTRSFVTSQDSVPPCASTQYYCIDQGISDPRKLCLTMYNVPRNEQLRSATKLPVGAIIQPFAASVPDTAIDVIDASQCNGPLRCRRCRSYSNPNYSFTFDSKAVCNFCQVSTQLSEEHYAPLNPNGLRADINERPDLTKGTVEFLVPDTYNTVPGKPNIPLHYVFLVDISTLSNENKSSLAMIEGIRTCIEHISAKQPNCKVAIMAFDKEIRFFNLRPELNQAQEYIISDLQDVFVPIFTGLFVRPEESMHVIQDTLCKITAYIEDGKFSHHFEACYGSALKAARLALDIVTGGAGGKILASLSSKPTHGIGNLRLRNEGALKKTLKCENEAYVKLGQELLKSNISLDLFCTGSAFMDMVSVAQPVKVTSGILKYYPGFQLDKDEFTFVNDLLHSVANTVGYAGQLKVRCSSGLSVYNYYSESVENSDREPVIPVLHQDTTVNVLFKYDGRLPPAKDVHFQCALLYTDLNGARKVRCLNASAAVSDNIHEIFKFVNQDAVVGIVLHDMLTTLDDCDFVQKRKTIDDKIVDVLTQYRALVSKSSSSQLVLPDSLKTWAAYLLSFEKSELMKNNNKSANGNSRVYDMFKYLNFTPAQLVFKLYPQIQPLHELLQESDYTFYDENELLLQAAPLENLCVRASRSELVDGGCYLIFDGTTAYLWFNENTNTYLLRDLLDVDTDSVKHSEIALVGNAIPTLDSGINLKARSVLRNWAQVAGRSYVPVTPLRPHVDVYYSHTMAALLVEDRSIEMIEAYDAYLVSLHKRINEKVKREDYTKVGNPKDHEHITQKFIQF